MGISFFGFCISISLLLRCFASQLPPAQNTDAFYVFEFFRQMGVKPSTTSSDSSDVCSWRGVSCKGDKVIRLEGPGFGFSGPIKETTLGKLDMLQVLDLSNNKITGLSGDLAGLGNLTNLNLSSNKISGTLPMNIGNFELMESLDLSHNQFSGEISAQLSSLSKLRVLNLSRNSLGMSIPDAILDCTSLVSVDLSNNKLSGSLPSGFGAAFKSLSTLDLSGNQLNGSMPDFSGLNSITYLDLSGNNFHGNISQVLDLSKNHIAGNIPEMNTAKLQVIDLSVNNLTGEIPKSLQHKLSSMVKFNFSYNNLSYCGEKFSLEVLSSSFIGSQNGCPIAVNPDSIASKERKHKSLKLGLSIAFSLFFLLTGLIYLTFACRKRAGTWVVKQISHKEEQNGSGPFHFQTDSTTWVADIKLATSVPVAIFEKPLLNITFSDLLNVTSNFDRGTLLAEGRFGPVHHGFLPGGIHVAMKVLVHGSAVSDQDAAKELERLGQIKHPNLVPLAGYCLTGDQRIVIYDYMENGNLQNLLHDLPLGVRSTEDWTSDTWEQDNAGLQSITTEGMTTWRFRHKIALGAARALAFLHHGCFPQIVHRDVKASSIYLDSALEPRLADFGLSSIAGASIDLEMSQRSTGYAPPELSEPDNASATTKSDIYGFGVVLFELITGKKPIGDEYAEERESTLVSWARTLVKANQLARLIDPKIRETGPEKQMEEALKIAYLCTADLPLKRPSMQQIVGLLKDIEPVTVEH
ncbi:hypothetical protein Cni_G03766 [Canna indica]|uniref:Protein kinase domain-containing protein n=1 Tax=Canna indica TaxID=4628 RepID=A0AAQ3JRU1_9LILI|nr:hypothetical protein Cni_G03766 [Canna indica]